MEGLNLWLSIPGHLYWASKKRISILYKDWVQQTSHGLTSHPVPGNPHFLKLSFHFPFNHSSTTESHTLYNGALGNLSKVFIVTLWYHLAIVRDTFQVQFPGMQCSIIHGRSRWMRADVSVITVPGVFAWKRHFTSSCVFSGRQVNV